MAEQEPDTDGKPGDNKEEADQVGQQLSYISPPLYSELQEDEAAAALEARVCLSNIRGTVFRAHRYPHCTVLDWTDQAGQVRDLCQLRTPRQE